MPSVYIYRLVYLLRKSVNLCKLFNDREHAVIAPRWPNIRLAFRI